jgi:asparagine synthase (glutamine-hydrolysing)
VPWKRLGGPTPASPRVKSDMCGICGVITAHGENPVTEAALRGMCQLLRHRGPDDEGYYCESPAWLAIRRLSIIDLAEGRQPMTNEDGTIWLVFNGEIYNFRELREVLEQRGHRFVTHSDSEVIVHAYEEYGDAFTGHFNGMFALAIWDRPRRRLLLARDRLGIKPLYYWTGRDQLVFGSELKAVLAFPDVECAVDPVALDQYLALEYVPTPRSIVAGVQKLPAGHQLVYLDGQVTLHSYWDVSATPQTMDQAGCAEQLVDLIQDAVRLQLVSDVPLGAFLSGGIDSSTIVAFMSRLSPLPVQTFSIGFGDATYNELPEARAVAAHFGTRHTEAVLEPDIVGLASDLVWHLDEPFADFSVFPTYLVSRLARQSVKVVLSGDGGDELFAGYDTYVAQGYDRFYGRLPAILRQRTLPALLASVPPASAKKGLINKAKRFVEGGALRPELGHTRWMLFMSAEDRRALYRPEWRSAMADKAAERFLEGWYQQAPELDPLGQQQYVDIKTYLVDDILTKVDRMSMAASLEARVPLLDHRVVEFALALPAQFKLHQGVTKVILRRAMQGILPDAVLRKPKQGFSIPMKHWLRGPLRVMMSDLLSGDCIRGRGYFEAKTVSRWVDEHLQGRANHSHRLWALMMFELWQRHVTAQKGLRV